MAKYLLVLQHENNREPGPRFTPLNAETLDEAVVESRARFRNLSLFNYVNGGWIVEAAAVLPVVDWHREHEAEVEARVAENAKRRGGGQ